MSHVLIRVHLVRWVALETKTVLLGTALALQLPDHPGQALPVEALSIVEMGNPRRPARRHTIPHLRLCSLSTRVTAAVIHAT